MIKLIKTTFYNEKKTKQNLANFILKTDYLSMGAECNKFESNFALKQERKYAIFVSNGSMANLILVQSMLNSGRIKKGDKIGVSSLTWATNIMPLIQLGLEPVMIDCSLMTLNISPETLRPKINEIKALFITNVLGFCDDLHQIKRMCDENAVILMEDNCESLGSVVGGKLLGNFGIASTFSFFVGHHLSTIEGGMICTDDNDLADALIMTRAHGWDRNLNKEKQEQLRSKAGLDEFYAKYGFYDLAYNGRPTEIGGFLGNEQIGYWDKIVEKRSKNFARFQGAVIENDDFIPLEVSFMNIISNFAFPLICRNRETFKKYIQKFNENNVEIRPIIAGDMTKQPFCRKYFTFNECKNASYIHNVGFYFGNNPDLTEAEIAVLLSLLKK